MLQNFSSQRIIQEISEFERIKKEYEKVEAKQIDVEGRERQSGI